MSWTVVRVLEVGLVGIGLTALYNALTLPTIASLVTLVVLYVGYRRERKRAAGTIPLTGKHVLITGCDSGFGFALANKLHGLGCNVIATVFNPESVGAAKLRDVKSRRMTVIPLDVSSDDSVKACLDHVKDLCRETGLWGLVNNAGQGLRADAELITMSQYLHIANVNVFGTVRCTRAFLPLLRQSRGRIVNVSSIRGLMSFTYSAAYNISKYGIETFSDIVRLETKQFGIKVSIIEPCKFGGSPGIILDDLKRQLQKHHDLIWQEASDEVKEIYSRRHLEILVERMDTFPASSSPTLDPVIDAMTEALTSGDPEIRYLVSGSNSFIDSHYVLGCVKPFVSDRMFDWLTLYSLPHKIHKK